MKKKIFTSVGLMSGTSMDGVDLSVIKSDGNDQFSSIYDIYKEFDDELYNQLISLRDKINNSTDLKTHSKEIQVWEDAEKFCSEVAKRKRQILELKRAQDPKRKQTLIKADEKRAQDTKRQREDPKRSSCASELEYGEQNFDRFSYDDE